MRYLNKNEVLSIPKIVAKLNKFRNIENRSTDRVVQSNVYNFYVNTQSALYIKNDNQETYTFEVKRDVCDGKVENLVLVSMPDNSFRVLLVKYYFTYAEKESTGFNPANYPNPTYTEIDFDYDDLLSKCEYKTDYICVESYEYSCDIPTNQGNNVGGAPIYTCGWSVTAASCYLLMTSSGCNGGEGSGLTNFTTGPVTTSQGYYADGINLTLTPKQRLFMNALNVIGKDNFSALDGGVQLNIFNFIEGNSTVNSSTVANFINSNNMSWITIQEVATQQSIFNYLIANNFSSSSVAFVDELKNTSIQLGINVIDIWFNDYENFRNQMSNSERAIFDSILPNRQMWYMASAYKALEKSNELFPNTFIPSNSHNGKGDAFRHALWNAFFTGFCGASLAEQLTTAHEEKIDPYNPFPQKEIDMDLFNNQKGRLIASYSNINNVTQNVLNYLNSGGLRYLSVLNPNPPYYPTSYSTLIPTNQ